MNDFYYAVTEIKRYLREFIASEKRKGFLNIKCCGIEVEIFLKKDDEDDKPDLRLLG